MIKIKTQALGSDIAAVLLQIRRLQNFAQCRPQQVRSRMIFQMNRIVTLQAAAKLLLPFFVLLFFSVPIRLLSNESFFPAQLLQAEKTLARA